MESVYDAAGGLAGLTGLAHAWHEQMMADPLGSHPFSHGFRPDHSERLAAYWAEALGGPPAYTSGLGTETEVVRMHSGNGAHPDLDAVAIECFDRAMDEVGLTDPVRRVLHDYFAWSTTGPMARFHGSEREVPDGLPLPRWSWDGLQEPVPHAD